MTLGAQVWAARWTAGPPTPDRVAPVTNRPLTKPTGGLWTSTYRQDIVSDWVRFVVEQWTGAGDADLWLLTPDADARVHTIHTYPDLAALADRYPPPPGDQHRQPVVDWEAAAHDLDAVCLTEDGQWATRLTEPLNLYGWDCESTLWFRWRFCRVTCLGRARISGKPAGWSRAWNAGGTHRAW